MADSTNKGMGPAVVEILARGPGGWVLAVRDARRVPFIETSGQEFAEEVGSSSGAAEADMVQETGPVFCLREHFIPFNYLAETEHHVALPKEAETWAWRMPFEVLRYPLNCCIVSRAESHLRGIHG